MRQLSIMDSMLICALPAALTATILGTQSSSLLNLHIAAARVGLAGAEIAALAVLTRLTCLSVRSRLFTHLLPSGTKFERTSYGLHQRAESG